MNKHPYVARFTEGIALIKALWTQPSVTFDGEFWQLKDATMEPKPLQKPHPPLWLGGSSEIAARRAARLGDGFFGAGSVTTSAFREQVTAATDEAARHGKPGLPIAKRVYIAVDDDPARAYRLSAKTSLAPLDSAAPRMEGRGGSRLRPGAGRQVPPGAPREVSAA